MSGITIASFVVMAAQQLMLEKELEEARRLWEQKNRVIEQQKKNLERQRAVRQEWKTLERLKDELAGAKENLKKLSENLDILVEKLDTGRTGQRRVKELVAWVEELMNEAESCGSDRELEQLRETNRKIDSTVKEAQETYDQQRLKIKELSSSYTYGDIDVGVELNIDQEIRRPLSYIEHQQGAMQEILDTVGKMNLSHELLRELNEIEKKAREITDRTFIDNYYAMTVIPFVKRCEQQDKWMEKNRDEFSELVSRHMYCCEYLGIPQQMTYVCSPENFKALRETVEQLESQCLQAEEQNYIAKSMDEVMRDMGYRVIGDREVTKKSGKRFRNELYHFSEGTAVNITYAAEGQIGMELGGMDTCDREPTEAEVHVLCDEMTEFCEHVPEIEKRLKDRGILLAKRITQLPPTEDYAQIINVSDYCLKDAVEQFDVSSRRQGRRKEQVLRKE